MRKKESQSFDHTPVSKYFCKICNFFDSKYFVYLMCSILFLFSIFLIVHDFTKYAILTTFVLLGFLSYMFINKSLNVQKYIISQKYGYLLVIIFMLSFSFSIIYLQVFASLYAKPLPYYICIGICSSSIFLITYSKIFKRSNWLMPFLLVLLDLNVFLSNYIVFPNGVYASGDSHFQIYKFVLPIVESGNIPTVNAYSFFPLHNIYVASVSLISNLEPVHLYLFLPGIIYTIIGLFLYSFAHYFFKNPKIGPICVLFYTISPDIVYHATHAYQFSYAAPIGIILILFAILLYFPKDNYLTYHINLRYRVLFILFIATLVWTHQYTSAVILALLVILLFTSSFVFKNKTIGSYTTITFLYMAVLFVHWMYISNVFGSLVDIFSIYYNSIMMSENYQASIALSESGLILKSPLWIIFSDVLGIGLIFILSVIGSIYGIRKNNVYIFLMTLWGVFIWGLVSVGSFVKMPLLLNSRLLTLFWALSISYIAAIGVLFISNKLGKTGVMVCCLLFFVITAFNLGSTLSGSETSFLLGDQPYIKLYDTAENLNAYSWIKENIQENSSIKMSESWVPQSYDPIRFYRELSFNNQNNIDISQFQTGQYVLLTKDSSKGLRIRGIDESSQLQLVKSQENTTVDAYLSLLRTIKIDYSKLQRMVSSLDCIYSNGDVCINLE